MRTPCTIAFFLSIVCCVHAQSDSFEIFNQRQVPFPNKVEPNEGHQVLADFLADIAVSEEVNNQAAAQLLAAAQRLHPVSKKAIYTEYELSQSMSPSLAKAVEGDVESALDRHFAEALPGEEWQSYRKFVKHSLKGELGSPLREITQQTCGVLGTEAGVVKVVINKAQTDKKGVFQFVPNGLNSSYFRSAYREVAKYLSQSGSAKLSGQLFRFQSDKILSGKEGPVAALAASVLSTAVIDGIEIDPEVCLSGDVNADGSVQPMNDQRQRLLAAFDNPPEILVIPKGDHYVVDDLLLLDGVAFFVDCQVFEVSNVEQALHIAKSERNSDLKQAISLYTQVQKVLKGSDGKKYDLNRWRQPKPCEAGIAS